MKAAPFLGGMMNDNEISKCHTCGSRELNKPKTRIWCTIMGEYNDFCDDWCFKWRFMPVDKFTNYERRVLRSMEPIERTDAGAY